MTKQELVQEIARFENLPAAQISDAVDTAIRIIRRTLCKGEALTLRGLGTLKAVECKPRPVRDITRGTTIQLSSFRKLKIVTSPTFKSLLNAPSQTSSLPEK